MGHASGAVNLPKALLSLGTGEGVAERSTPKDAGRNERRGFSNGISRKLGLGTFERPIALVATTSPRAGDFLRCRAFQHLCQGIRI
jgi:hypothetical protein